MAGTAHRIEVAAGAVTVEGELLDEACDELELALRSLRNSGLIWTTVDLSRVTAAAPGPIGVLFGAWLDLFKQGRAPFLEAPDHIWRMLGRVATESGSTGLSAADRLSPPPAGSGQLARGA